MTRAACEVLVIGGGPAGIAAATRSAERGARTLLVDEGLAPGGQIWRASGPGHRVGAASGRIDRLARSGAAIRSGTSVADIERVGGGFTVTAEGPGIDPVAIGARAIVIATGARELFLPFPGWTLPGVVGVGGAQALLKSGMSVGGKRVVVAGSGPLVLAVSASLASHGARVQVVAEQAPTSRVARFATGLWRTPSRAAQALALRARLGTARFSTGTWVVRADGEARVEAVTLTDGRSTRSVACDLLCVAFGLVPNTELARLAGCEIGPIGVRVDDEQATTVPGIFCAGEPTGIGGVELSLVEGEIAGGAASGSRATPRQLARRARRREEAESLASAFALRPELLALGNDDTIVCRCEDVRLGELDRGWTFRQAKLYTRVGMGPCQGRICGAALECVLGWSREMPRPPIQPIRAHSLLEAGVEAGLQVGRASHNDL